MEYKVAKVIVTGAEARAVDKRTITRGMTGAVVEFEYHDPMWDDLNKMAVFEGYSEPVGFLANSNTVVLPWEVTTQIGALVKVGVYGEDAAGNQVIPTIWAELGNVKSAPGGNFNPPGAPTPTPWAQILAMIGDLRNLDTESKDNLVNAINEVAKSGGNNSGSGQNVDLTGYAKETWVQEGFQPKGTYLTEVPTATTEKLGGVKPTIAKNDTMTQPVSVDENGGLWTAPGASGTVLVAASDAPDIIKAAAQYVCTGVNDQLVINAAIVAVGKGEVRLSGGNYYITGEITLLDDITLTGRNAIINVCDEISSTITQAYAGGDTVIHVADASVFVLGQKVSTDAGLESSYPCRIISIDTDEKTVTLDAPLSASSGIDANTKRLIADFTAVSCIGRSNAVVDGVIINGNGSTYGAYDTYCGGNGVEFLDSENCKIVNCTILAVRKHGIAIFASTACNVEHSLIDGCYDLGIDISNRLGGDGGHIISGCTIRNTNGRGVQIHYGQRVNVIGCTIYNNTTGIGTQGSGRELIISGCNIYSNGADNIRCNVSPGKNVIITGNIIANSKAGGIQFDAVENALIANNLIFGNVQYGIKMLGSNHCVISNNKLYDNCNSNTDTAITAKAAIVIRKACSYALVTGNNIQITSTSTTGCPCGITESELTGDYNIVTGNIIRGARIAATNKLGTNSVFENNYEFS